MEYSLQTKDRQLQTVLEPVLMLFYGAVLFLMYYRGENYISVGGLQLLMRLVYSFILTGTAVVHFIVFTDIKRGAKLLSSVLVMALPNLILVFSSIPVWVLELTDFSVMRRGLVDQLYGIGMVTMCGGLYYVFGKKGFQLNLIAVLAAYLVRLAEVIARFGLGTFMAEFVRLVITFADDTGPAVRAAEFHEATFCVGMLLLGIGFRLSKKEKLLWIEFGVGMFCFLTGFKRIAMVAAAGAYAVYFVLLLITHNGKRHMWLVTLTGALSIAACYCFLLATKMGLFAYLESLGINTMGRAYLSNYVDQYYTMTPEFLGHGTGFVSRLMSMREKVRALHNGPLQIYIDNGFWGFWFWGLAFMPIRISHFTKTCGGKVGLIVFCSTLALLLTAMTDNTIYYSNVLGAMCMVFMYYRMEGEKA